MERIILCFAVTMFFLLAGKTSLQAQDLTIATVDCPKTAKAGQDLKSTLQLLVANTGDRLQKAVTVKLVLKNSPLCPKSNRPAAYSPKYYDGVQLRQGREILSLEPGTTRTIIPHGANTIPWDTPVGRTYYLCAVIEPENPLKGDNKDTNCACCPIKIIGAEEGPVAVSILEKCLVPGKTITILGRNFGPVSGTVTALSTSGITINLPVSSWSDSTVIVRIPNDSRLQDGQMFIVNIMRNGESESISTGRQKIGTCAEPKKTSVPGTTQPMPPLFFEQQP